MPFALSKILPLLVYPLSLACWFLIAAFLFLIFQRGKSAGLCLFIGIAILGVSTSPIMAHRVFASLENQYPPVKIEHVPTTDAIVVLGGGVGLPLPPRLHADLTSDADRVLHAARLFRAGKAPIVIVSGGQVFPESKAESESHYMSELLVEWGVVADSIISEPNSRTTFENAVETKKVLDNKGIRNVSLVTSAFHMPRAYATFKKLGIDTTPSPTDYKVLESERPDIFSWIPSAGALSANTKAFHEYLGALVYRWRGWMD